jgi:dienelactone hydrolase
LKCYYVSPSGQAPFVLLIHDWDGLTDYEVKRANMLAELGYAVFALDLFGAGVAHEMITYGGAQHAFTVFGGKRYQETADKKSWKRFTEFLADTLKN